MIKSKVFEILNSLTKEEFKRFHEFVSSPYFNKKEALIKLTQVYNQQYPDFANENFTKESVFKKIFPDKKYNDEVFRNLNSDLMKLGEEFLAFNNIYSDPYVIKRHLLAELNKRKLFSTFEKSFVVTKTILDNYPHKDLKYIDNLLDLYLLKDNYNAFRIKFSKEDINEAKKYLINSFIIRLMEIETYVRHSCRILEIENSQIMSVKLIEDLLKNIPEKILLNSQVQIYYNALKLEETFDVKHYNNLRKLLLKYGHLLEKDNHYNKYVDLLNYITKTKPPNNLEAISESFQMRKVIIENRIYPDKFISNIFFISQVKAGLILKELEWVNNFVNNYSHIIVESFRKSTIELSMAMLNFEKKEIQLSLSHLAEVKNESGFYNVQIKNLLARIYYEMDDYLSLSNNLNSYKMFLISNKTMSTNEANVHNVFINLLNKLSRLKESKKYSKLDNIRKEIEKKEFPGKIWMFEKIEELETEEKNLFRTKLEFKREGRKKTVTK